MPPVKQFSDPSWWDEGGRAGVLMDTASDATEALARQRFADRVSAELAQLAEDDQACSEYLGEAEPSG